MCDAKQKLRGGGGVDGGSGVDGDGEIGGKGGDRGGGMTGEGANGGCGGARVGVWLCVGKKQIGCRTTKSAAIRHGAWLP